MKKLFLIAIALILSFTCAEAQYKTRDTTSIADPFAAAAVDTFNVTSVAGTNVNRTVVIRNYSPTATDTLVAWFNNDSTKLKVYIPARAVWKGRLLVKSINTRCPSATIYRPIEVSEGDIELTTNYVLLNGSVAAGATDAGNPIKVGGVYNSTLPTLTNGQRGDLNLDSRTNAQVVLMAWNSTTGAHVAVPSSDLLALTTGRLQTSAQLYTFDGATINRFYGNYDDTVGITAAGATTTQTGSTQYNQNGRGVKVILDMTNVGTGSVTLAIQALDPTSGKYYALLTGAAVTTNSTNVYTVYPGVTVAANVSASDILPRRWRVVVTANNANATTYTVAHSIVN